jgi:nucleoid DNA-binding protein
MTKAQFVEALSQQLDQSKQASERLLDAVFKTVTDALRQGEKVDLRGFGTFKIRRDEGQAGSQPAYRRGGCCSGEEDRNI